MCLTRPMTDKERASSINRKDGWKVFELRDGKLYGEQYSLKQERTVGEWLKSTNFSTTDKLWFGDWTTSYDAGWHVILKEEEADRLMLCLEHLKKKKFVKRKVQFKNPMAWGVGAFGNQIVALEMLIEE